jgi:hypothetical protein
MIQDDPIQACTELNALAEAKGWPMRCGCDEAFDRAELHTFCELWRSKAAGGVPARSAFNMRALKPFAGNITILERVATNGSRRYRFRLFGSTLTFLFGEHTGRYLDEMVAAELLPSWLAFYDTVLSCGQPLRIFTYYRIKTDDFVKGEILAAPLADDSSDVHMILAMTYVGLQDGVPPPFG